MLSEETLQEYRRMSAGERLKLTLQMSNQHLQNVLKRSPTEIGRWFAQIRRENDLRNINMLTAIARTRRPGPAADAEREQS